MRWESVRRQMMIGGAIGSFVFLAACGMPSADSPLTRAVQQGNLAEVQALLAHRADPNEREGHGWTPLVLAARTGQVGMARVLLEAGADPNLMDSLYTRPGWTPLMNAVHTGQIKSVQVLIEAGVDANLKSSNGTTALMLATGEESTGIVRLLLEAGADPHPGVNGSAALTNAVANCRISNVKVLLERAPDLKLEAGIRGSAALWLARLRGHAEIVRLIEQAEVKGRTDLRRAS